MHHARAGAPRRRPCTLVVLLLAQSPESLNDPPDAGSEFGRDLLAPIGDHGVIVRPWLVADGARNLHETHLFRLLSMRFEARTTEIKSPISPARS